MADPWNEIAAKYAEVTGDVRQHFLHPVILQAVCDTPCPRRCLDFGCGPGGLTEQLTALCEEVVAVDLALSAVEAARRRLGSLATVLENAAFADHPGRFDIIVLSMVITTIQSDKDLECLLAMLRQRLNAGGRLIIGTTHPCFTFRALSQVRYANSGASYEVLIAPGLNVTEYTGPWGKSSSWLPRSGCESKKQGKSTTIPITIAQRARLRTVSPGNCQCS